MKPEDYIQKNASRFDTEPTPGHRERFAALLDAALQPEAVQHRPKRRFAAIASWTAAAAVVLFFAWVGPGLFRDGTVQDPVEQVLDYYTGLLQQEAEPLYALARKLDDPSRQELLQSIGILTNIPVDEDSARFGEEHQVALIYNIYRSYSDSIHHLAGILEENTEGCAAGQL